MVSLSLRGQRKRIRVAIFRAEHYKVKSGPHGGYIETLQDRADCGRNFDLLTIIHTHEPFLCSDI